MDWINVSFDVLNALYLSLWITSFVASWKQTQTTECLPQAQGSGQCIKKARPSHLRSNLELRTLIPAISSKTLRLSRLLFLNHRELNGGKNCHEAFVQAHLVQVRRAPHLRPQPLCCQTFESQNHPIWVPTLLILNVSEKGRGAGTCLTLLTVAALHNLSTSSKPVPNSVWPTSRVAGFFS